MFLTHIRRALLSHTVDVWDIKALADDAVLDMGVVGCWDAAELD